MLEEKLERSVEQSAAALTAMADDFFDHPEVGQQEFHAFETLTGWLEKEGFTVERGIAGMKTAFRDRKSTRLNSSHNNQSRMPSSA